MIEEDPSPPLQLGPFQVEHLGRRGGLLALQVRIGRQTVRIFADRGNMGARVRVKLGDTRLVKRRPTRRKYRVWSRDLIVKRWIIGSAAEFVDTQPRWSYRQIAANLARSGRAKPTAQAVCNMVRRLAPELARRRAAFYLADPRRRFAPKKLFVPTKNPWARKKRRKEIRAVMEKAGLLDGQA